MSFSNYISIGSALEIASLHWQLAATDPSILTVGLKFALCSGVICLVMNISHLDGLVHAPMYYIRFHGQSYQSRHSTVALIGDQSKTPADSKGSKREEITRD